LDFLQDPKRETKAAQALDTIKRQMSGPGEKGVKGSIDLDNVTILPPISRPTKIICMGGNFSDHLKEGSTTLPPFPISFLKSPNSLVGHRAPVVYPSRVKLLDYEVELAAVIGKACKDVSRKDALDYVAGFSVFNDISARDIQFAEMKRGFCNLGKNFATFAPMGPFLVTPDQAGNPDDLGMELRVNGQTRQLSSTKNMVFKMRELVEFFSSMTLEPGDIITSGTPSGVAIYRKPDKEPYLLKPGDLIEAKIDTLGKLQNTIVQASKTPSPIPQLASS
jgi:2-keto-4-pentenoate hydratase/2-oxohepta-3-ene-1,7-dioic acid hydratase in catechol pathway